MDIAIIYEKIKIGEDKYLLKPICVEEGTMNKGFFLSVVDEIYFNLNDGEHFGEADELYGNATTIEKLSVANSMSLDDYDIMDQYYEKYRDQFFIAQYKDSKLQLEKFDLTEAIKSYEQKKPDVNDKCIAILYEKQILNGAAYPTYMLRPTGTILGTYNSETEQIESVTDKYSSAFNKDALSDSSDVYYGYPTSISDILDSPNEDDVVKLQNKYYALYESNILFAICKDPFTVRVADVNVIADLRKKEKSSASDLTILNYLDQVEEQIKSNDKKVLLDEYRKINKFLFADGKIEDVSIEDITKDTIDLVAITNGRLKHSALKEKINYKIKEVSKEKEKTKLNTYDPNNLKFPEYSWDDLYRGITNVVIGQDDAVAEIVSNLYMRMIELTNNPTDPSQYGLLVTGSSGTGKSEIFKMFSHVCNHPIQFMAAPDMTAAGYVGRDIESYLENLYSECKGDMKKVSNALIVLDEIDKIKANPGEGKDVNGKAVQDILLKFIDGNTYDVSDGMFGKISIKTGGMSSIGIGAFDEMYNAKVKNKIGFNGDENKVKQFGTEDFIKYGMDRQFMRRLHTIVHLNDLDISVMLRILNESAKSPLKIKKQIYNSIGIEAIFTDEYKKAAANEAMKRKLGAGGLAGIVDETTCNPIAEISANRGKYNKVIFTEDTIKDAKKYTLKKD